jgi:plasmid stabilization system protein ParE
MPNKIYWTRQAREDLREIRAFIARDAPITAAAFVRRLRASVDRLRSFPRVGQVVTELGNEEIRELIRGQYRVIYRCRIDRIDILTVYHSSRLLDETQF